MNRSSTVVKIQTDQSGIIEQLETENKLLKEFIGKSSIDEIHRLQEVEKKLAVCQAQLVEKDKAYNDLKAESDKRVKLAKDSAFRIAEGEKKEAVKNKEYNMRKLEVKPLKQEVERKEKEIETLKVSNEDLMRQHEKTHSMLQDMSEKIDKILGILASSDTIEEARQEVKKVVSSSDDRYKIIHQMIQEGKTNQQTAEALGISTVRVSQIIKNKKYVSLYGEEGFR